MSESYELAQVDDVVNRLITMSELQNDSAVKTANRMEIIVTQIDKVHSYSDRLNHVVELIEHSNGSIIESIQTISSITNTVSENTRETYQISEQSSNVVHEVIDYVDALKERAMELRNLT